MSPLVVTILTLGGLLLSSLLADAVGRRTPIPRVTLLLLFGVLIGPSVLDVLPSGRELWFPLVADVALMLVAFSLGRSLQLHRLREHGREVLWISVGVVLGTWVCVALGVLAAGVAVPAALLLGAVATATDPAASADVVDEAGAKGPLTETLLGIVAVDDAWGLVVFSISLAIADAVSGASGSEALATGVWDVFGGIGLGALLGFPLAWLARTVRRESQTIVLVLGVTLLCGGLALHLELSFLLACVTLGAVVANRAAHADREFRAARDVNAPVLVLFFVLAGASVDVPTLLAIGVPGLVYLLARAGSRIAAARFCATRAGSPLPTRRWIGVALMPQAGVALGMALIASQRRPELADLIIPIVVGSTIVFEVVGPPLTRLALRRAGEVADPQRVE